MIKVFYQHDIIDRLAAIFTYGLNNGYSYETIEERIISSPFVNNLEKNEYDIESKIDKVGIEKWRLEFQNMWSIS